MTAARVREKSKTRKQVRTSKGGHDQPAQAAPTWTFLTNHAHVLLCLAETDDVRVRDIALRVGVTERAVQRILSELEEAGYIRRERDGRRNVYEIKDDLPLRHPIEAHRTIRALLDLVQR